MTTIKNIYRIDNIEGGKCTAHHISGKTYEIGCEVKHHEDVIELILNSQDVRMINALPVPEITLAPPSVITAEPYFKTQ